MRNVAETEQVRKHNVLSACCNRRQLLTSAFFEVFGVGIMAAGFNDLIKIEKEVDAIDQEVQRESQTLSSDERGAILEKKLDEKNIDGRTRLGYFRIGGGGLFAGLSTLGIAKSFHEDQEDNGEANSSSPS